MCAGKGAGSVFNLGEIVRLMKFPGVAKTFIVKIISGLPSGETHTYNNYILFNTHLLLMR